jgi:vancomycin resistance protein YoaR
LDFYKKQDLPLEIKYNREKLNVFIFSLSGILSKKGVSPSVSFKDGAIIVEKGIPGEFVDSEQIIHDLQNNLSYLNYSDIAVNINFDNNVLSQEQADILYQRAEKLLNKKLVISFEDYQNSYSNNSLFALLGPFGGYNQNQINNLVDNEARVINRPPQNPVFNFSNGVVKEFLPAKDGVKIEIQSFEQKITDALKNLEETDQKVVTIDVPTNNTPPDYKTEDVNSMGIKQLIGKGKSKYAGSIASRIHNIVLASSHFNGVLVAPGETFSFNKTLGDVSQETGYQQAYIIKEGSTILGDGGGVCQVSTTLFRAILDAGLPIVERQAHAYRVGYYEQDSPPGLDATVYEPSPDLKFKNDTPGHILIQTIADTKAKTLTFEIYGTDDGRVATVSKPIVTDVTQPPEDLYIDDSTLPAGEIKQIDWKAWGAKVWFDYKVTRAREVIYSKRFYSNYRPWQAKFLRGTGPAQ